MKTLTPDEQNFVKENYKSMSSAELGKELKIPVGRVRQNKIIMGLTKHLKREIPDQSIEDEFWNDMLHEKYFYY